MGTVSPLTLRSMLKASDICDVDGDDVGVTPTVRVKLKFYDATAIIGISDVDDCLTLQASLPAGPGSFSLTEQGSGISSRFAQLSEQKLGIQTLDDAFIVKCDDDGFSLLRLCEVQLVAMLPVVDEARVELTASTKAKSDSTDGAIEVTRLTAGMLHITWPAERVAAMLAFWERLYAIRIGA